MICIGWNAIANNTQFFNPLRSLHISKQSDNLHCKAEECGCLVNVFTSAYAGSSNHVAASTSLAVKRPATQQSLPTLQKLVESLQTIPARHQQCSIASLAPLHQKAAIGSEAYGSHPAPADATLHLGAVNNKAQGPSFVPVGLKALRIHRGLETLPPRLLGWAVTGKTTHSSRQSRRLSEILNREILIGEYVMQQSLSIAGL